MSGEQVNEEKVRLSGCVIMFSNITLCQYGNVYEGEMASTPKPHTCAIKFARQSEQNLREERVLRKLGSHHHVICLYDSGTFDDGLSSHYFLVLEKCHELNLCQYLSSCKESVPVYDVNWRMNFCKQLLDGIEYIHSKLIIHKDLKPSNILLSLDLSTIKIADFGSSQDIDSATSAIYCLNMFGTMGFRPPESFGGSYSSLKSDIFSLGVLLYFLLSNGYFCDEELHGEIPKEKTAEEDDQDLIENERKFLAAMEILRKNKDAERAQGSPRQTNSRGSGPLPSPSSQDKLQALVASPSGTTGISTKSQGNLKTQDSTQHAEKEEFQKILQVAELQLAEGDGDSVIKRVEEFLSKESRSAMAVKNMANDFKSKGHYVQAMILYKMSHDLHKKEGRFSPDDELNWTRCRIINIHRVIVPLIKVGGTSRKFAFNFGVKFIKQFLKDLCDVKHANPEHRDWLESLCLHLIACVHCLANKFEECIRFGVEGLNIMTQRFGENASNYSLYGSLWHNVGVAYVNSGRYSNAESCFITALEIRKIAPDYKNEEKREDEIALTKRYLEETRKKIVNQK